MRGEVIGAMVLNRLLLGGGGNPTANPFRLFFESRKVKFPAVC